MAIAAYILGTAAVPANTICSILSATRFFGPCVTRLPFVSTVPMSGFPFSSKKSLDRALVAPNSRSSMRRRSSLRRGLSGVPLYSGGSEPHGTNSREEVGLWCEEAEWIGSQGRWSGT